MKQEELILGLKKVVGDDRVITDDASIEVASRDIYWFSTLSQVRWKNMGTKGRLCCKTR